MGLSSSNLPTKFWVLHSSSNTTMTEDDLVFYIPFNMIKVISRQWKDGNERLCAIKHHIAMSPL